MGKWQVAVLLMTTALVACSPQETAVTVVPAQCGMDTDCKGDRICEAGICQAPKNDAVMSDAVPPLVVSDALVQATLERAVTQFLLQANEQEGDGGGVIETADERDYLVADISGDGLPDLVATAFIGMEGGNADYRQLFVFQQRDGQWVPVDVQAADRGGLADFSVNNGVLELLFLTHDENDARCCPSLESRERYAIVSDALVARP